MNESVKYSLKLLALPLLLLAALSTVYVLPERGDITPSSISMTLPLENELLGWYGIKRQESELERKLLSPDTKFSKADYFDMSLGERANMLACHVSIILSGDDMNSSIHRPELCLPSQGHFNLRSRTKDITLGNARKISVSVLDSQINVTPDNKKPDIINALTYYVFIGNKSITHKHEYRVLMDMKKRILQGEDQRWAYIQVNLPYGGIAGTTKEEAEAEVEKLLKILLPQIIKWEEIDQ